MSSQIEKSLISELVSEITTKLMYKDPETVIFIVDALHKEVSRMPYGQQVSLATSLGIINGASPSLVAQAMVEKFESGDDIISNHLFRYVYGLGETQQVSLFEKYDMSDYLESD